MPRELSNPLQALIAGAAKSTPAVTGETDRYHARFNRASQAVVILADVSTSMAQRAGSRRKIEVLREALAGVWADLPGGELIAFSSVPASVVAPADIPEPNGGTALHLAIDEAAKSRPRKTVVISDGQPDSESLALAAADRITGIIDVIYCGPDSDTDAIAFMYRLARAGCGRVVRADFAAGSLAIGREVRAVLALPSPRNGA